MPAVADLPAASVSRPGRFQGWVAGLWAGLSLAVGGVAAPSLFLSLDRVSAGQGAGFLFGIEARISLALAVLSFVLERRRVRAHVAQGLNSSALSAPLLLVMAVLFLTVFGQFALHPLMEAAKAGQPTRLSFGALHGVSAGLYWLKVVLLLTLSWRLSGLQR